MRRSPWRSAAAPILVLGAAILAPHTLADVCEGISPASPATLTSVRVASGHCSNDINIGCVAQTTCRFCNNDHTIPCTVSSNCAAVGGACGTQGTCRIIKPLYVTSPPGDTHRIFIVDQDGRIWIRKDGVILATPYLDIDAIVQSTGNEEGLLSLAFSPNYETDGLFFVFHTENGGGANTIARYQVSIDPDLADPLSRTVVLSIPHASNSNHNGGGMQFAPDDGYLYIGAGDGGSSCDPPGNAQNTGELKGKLLRIDVIPAPVLPDPPYRIPPSNPFVGPGNPLDEIWTIGMRNPWRFSFDTDVVGSTVRRGDLYVGDVGQDNWEEIDYLPTTNTGGGNFGWDHHEGLVCPPTICGGVCVPIAPRVDPVKVYSLAGSPCAVTGGYVYRGCRMPALASLGRYFYADYCAATISSFILSGGVVTSELSHTAELAPVGGYSINLITSWGVDGRGELYFTDRGLTAANPAEIFKIVPVLSKLEVSGIGAAPFLLGNDWSWEDLALTSDHPISQYRVYRDDGNGTGPFACVYKTPPVTPPTRPPTVWPGGDPSSPLPANVYSYVVTAVRLTPLEETSPGTGTGGAPRVLSAIPCP